MESLGKRLRETRERLGLSLVEAEHATRIRVHHLQAIERGEMELLPSPVQARGFLRNYAEFLGLDSESVLLDYAEILSATRSKRRAKDPMYQEARTRPSVQVRSSRPRWLSSDLFIAAGITIAIVAVLVWGVGRVMASLRGDESPTAEFEALLSPASTVTPPQLATILPTESIQTPQPAQATAIEPTATAPPLNLGPTSTVGLQLVLEKRAWLRILVDGVEAFQGRAAPGEILEFQAEERIEVLTGNGAGVRVLYNGQDYGLMGELGQVVVRLWTLDGPVTPTPSQTPTQTMVPAATETPSATGTATPEEEG